MASPKWRTERQAPVPESILERRFVEPILAGAKENLQRDGSLMPVLFVSMQSGESGIVPLELPDTTEEKYAYFGLLGMSLAAAGQRVQEALFLSEIWYVSAGPDSTPEDGIRPSEHPRRREAISVVGRDALRSRFTFVVQLFHRDSENRLVFDTREVEEFNVAAGAGRDAVGLIDALFPRRTPLM